MAAFEFGNYPDRARPPFAQEPPAEAHAELAHAAGRLRTEPIMTLKIYDCCRKKNCLGPSELGPARHQEGHGHHGGPITVPKGAQSVSVEDLHVKRIVILSKKPSPFRNGFWDLDIKYVFDYDLRFFGSEGREMEKIRGTNTWGQRLSLFGSVGSEVTMATDLIAGGETTMGGEPFTMIEAKAMALTADIKHNHCEEGHHAHVFVTIGLFSIIKLFRLVSLLVESRGFVIPDSCGDVLPTNPCDFFDELSFPMDSFAPPQKREFMAGISCDIPGGASRAMEGFEEEIEG